MALHPSPSALSLLESGELPAAPAYILEGSDEYLLEQVLQLARRTLLEPGFSDFNWSALECSAATKLDTLTNALLELPMLTPQRLLELHYPQRLSAGVSAKVEQVFQETLEQGSNIILLVFHEEPKNCKSPLKKWAQKSGLTIKCSAYANEILPWARRYLERLSSPIEGAALRELQNRAGLNLADLSLQLEQLALYAGPGETITPAMVRAIIRQSLESKAWELTAALGAGDLRSALQVAASLLEDSPQRGALSLLSYLNSYLRSLAQIAHLAQRFGRSPKALAPHLPDKKEFLIRKSLEELRRWPEAKLREALLALTEADLALKTGADPQQTINFLLLQITPAAPSKQ